MKRHVWVWHPESPGVPVRVVRGFFARLVRPWHFATLDEVAAYDVYLAHLRARRDR